MKQWIKRKVHAYEKMRFDQEPIRTKLPFEWGLEHIGGDAAESDPRGYLERFVAETIAESDAWFRTPPAEDYRLEGNVLTFTSAIESPWTENNRVYAQYFPAPGAKARRRGAVLSAGLKPRASTYTAEGASAAEAASAGDAYVAAEAATHKAHPGETGNPPSSMREHPSEGSQAATHKAHASETEGERRTSTEGHSSAGSDAANGKAPDGAGGAKGKGRAVVVLAQWNARWDEQQGVCKWLNRLGITAVKMSLPYHDRRAIPGHRRADHLVAPNIGLTLQANRQAVMDVRATLRWLERQGYDRLGILGTSIGSCIGFITMCHEPAVRAGAFLHASTYFGDVVANGLTTANVWEQLAAHVTPEELRRFWAPISPTPYLHKLPGRDRKMLLITGKYDPTFWPEFTDELLKNMRAAGIEFASLRLPCGHYSLGVTPFKEVAGYRFGRFLAEALG
jgi:hypothetical protein